MNLLDEYYGTEYDGSLVIDGAVLGIALRRDAEPLKDIKARHQRVAAIMNATRGMSTEEAVRYLEHGREAIESLKDYKAALIGMCPDDEDPDDFLVTVKNLIAKMEGK